MYRLACALLFVVGCSSPSPSMPDAGVDAGPDAGVDAAVESCGDGLIGSAEACDPAAPLPTTCEAEGFYAGTLLCTSCQLDTTACGGRCGDGVINGPETCDGAPLYGCAILGETLGDTACSACAVDASACKSPGFVPVPEITNGVTELATNIWSSSENDVWVSTISATYHWDGSAWTSYPYASQRIWGFGPHDVFLATGNAMHHYDGTSFTTLPGPSTFPGLEAFWGRSANDLYATAADDTGLHVYLWHWNGTVWGWMNPLGEVRQVWGTATWLWTLKDGEIIFYNGISWDTAHPPVAFTPAILTGCGNTVFALGSNTNGAVLVRGDNNVWTQIALPQTQFDPYSITCSSADDVLVLGRPGTDPNLLAAFWYDGTNTYTVELDDALAPNPARPPVWGSLHSGAWFGGIAGHSGVQHARAGVATNQMFGRKVWRSSHDVWTAGDSGVFKNDVLQFADTKPLRSLFGVGDSFVIAAGDSGKASVWDGTSWTQFPTSTQPPSHTDVWARSPTDAYVATDYGLWHYDGNALTAFGPSGSYNAVWGTGASDLYVAESDGEVQWFDGTQWHQISAPIFLASELTDIWATGPSDVFVVGDSGLARHWDGTIWTSLHATTQNELCTISGTASDDVFIGSIDGTLYRWDGHLLVAVRSTPTIQGYKTVDIWATPGAVYATSPSWGGQVIVR